MYLIEFDNYLKTNIKRNGVIRIFVLLMSLLRHHIVPLKCSKLIFKMPLLIT